MIDPEEYMGASRMQRWDVELSLTEVGPRLSWTPGEMVLDVGCGPGDSTARLLLPLLPPDATLIGSDISKEMIKYANANFSGDNISFEEMDIQCTDVMKTWKSSTFDKIFSFYCLHWIEDQRQALRNLHYLLKPGGTLYFMYPMTHSLNDIHQFLSNFPAWKVPLNVLKQYSPKAKIEGDPCHFYGCLLREMGFEEFECTVKKIEFCHESLQQLLETTKAVDPVCKILPKDKLDSYMSDVKEILMKEKLAKIDPFSGVTRTEHKLIVVLAKKSF